MSNKSMIETAYDVFVKQGNSPKSLSFKELCQAVRDELGITDDEEFISKVGAFYTSLALDGRLVLLSDNTWDLRSRHTYDEIKKNTLEYYDTETADKDENGEAVDDEGLLHDLGELTVMTMMITPLLPSKTSTISPNNLTNHLTNSSIKMEELVFLLIYSFNNLDYAFQKGFIGPSQKMFAILLLAFE